MGESIRQIWVKYHIKASCIREINIVLTICASANFKTNDNSHHVGFSGLNCGLNCV